MSFSFQGRTLRTIDEMNAAGKSVLFRVDLNAPVKDGVVTDNTRIAAILPSLHYLMEQKCKVTLISHFGRPEGKRNPKYTLMPVAERLAELLGKEVLFPEECIGDGVKKLSQEQTANQVLLLENLRYHADEESNSLEFAEKLKGNHDIYISDAFGALHRAHASTSALPSLFDNRGIGLLVQKELEFLYPLIKDPQRPYSVVLGGAKISDKLKVVESLIRKVDRLFIGGAMVFTFLKAKGFEIGNSLFEPEMVARAKKIMHEASERKVSIFFPKDFMIAKSMRDLSEIQTTNSILIPEGWTGLDIGPKSVAHFVEFLQGSKTVFWNGPMGWFEQTPFDQGTVNLGKHIAQMDAIKIIGGGDSAAAVAQAGLSESMSHISTGGGATLEFLEDPMLPGLKALLV
jgi:phosphoglycerate kinase